MSDLLIILFALGFPGAAMWAGWSMAKRDYVRTYGRDPKPPSFWCG